MFKKVLVFLAMVFVFSNFVYADYPYRNVCPGGGFIFKSDWYNSAGGYWVDKWNFAQCNCTSYAAFEMDQFGIEFNNSYKQPSGYSWGNGKDWKNAAQRAGIKVDQTPIPGDIVYWQTLGYYGHVAYVLRVVYDGYMNWQKIYIAEYNGKGDQKYSERWITRADNPSGFIHIVAYNEGIRHLFYLDSYEMHTASTEQTKEEWQWILAKVWNEYRCKNCKGDFSESQIVAIAKMVGGMGGGNQQDPTPGYPSDPGDVGKSSGYPDMNVKEVEIRRPEGKNHHSLTLHTDEPYEIAVKVNNKGTKKAKYSIYYYRTESKENFHKNRAKQVGKDGNLSLSPGASHTDQKRNLFASSTPGKYYIFARTNCDGDKNPPNDYSRNDDKEEYAVMTVLHPNLKLHAFIDKNLFAPGESIYAGAWTENQGADTRKDIKLKWYISQGTSFNNPVLLEEDNMRDYNLEAGEIKYEDISFTAPQSEGLYTLSIHTDSSNSLSEIDEADNWKHLVFEVKRHPPLVFRKGDLNRDGKVDDLDYKIFLANFGKNECGNIADLNGDCKVNTLDYDILKANFGK